MVSQILAPKFLIVYLFLASSLYVHFRGRVRLKLSRQLLDHSTLLAPYNALMVLFSAVPTRPVVDPARFPELEPLRLHWREIRDEARTLFEAGHIRPSETHDDIAFNTFFKRGWKRFYLKWYDDFMPSAKELCPRTVALCEAIPTINAAMFTLLPPRSRLGAHRDPFGGSLRYHLGLMTPNSDDCRIYVDGEPHAWRDGEVLMFDETYVHRVENDTDAYRVILFCDVTRPLHTPVLRGINRLVARHIVKASQTRNAPGDKVGVLNRISGWVYRYKMFLRRVKEANRPLYYVGKWAFILGLVWLIFLRGLI
jgi:beta-hydroxylase